MSSKMERARLLKVYLLRLREEGCPLTAEDRKTFNRQFYKAQTLPQDPAAAHCLRSDISKLYNSIKADTLPFFVKSDPVLKPIYAEVVANFKRNLKSLPNDGKDILHPVKEALPPGMTEDQAKIQELEKKLGAINEKDRKTAQLKRKLERQGQI